MLDLLLVPQIIPQKFCFGYFSPFPHSELQETVRFCVVHLDIQGTLEMVIIGGERPLLKVNCGKEITAMYFS